MENGNISCALLADRHSPLTEGIRGLLETTFEVVVMVADEASLMESLSRLTVTLAVVDLAVSRGEGLQLVQRLRSKFPKLKLIITSIYDEPNVVNLVFNAGADAFVAKRTIATDLLVAVDALLTGKNMTSRPVLGRS
jgi:DNA-binding NarL/FixJ family response regulator